MFSNDRNPFRGDSRLSHVPSSFVTPPERVRTDPLRLLMQQLNPGENNDMYNLLLSSVPPNLASILTGNEERESRSIRGIDLTISEGPATPGFGRTGTNRPEGDGGSLSDLLPGGVERALQVRGYQVDHPLLATEDLLVARSGGIAAMAREVNLREAAQSTGRPLVSDTDLFNERIGGLGGLGIDFRVGGGLNRFVMEEAEIERGLASMPRFERGASQRDGIRDGYNTTQPAGRGYVRGSAGPSTEENRGGSHLQRCFRLEF